jgi:hypothetical protein
MDRVGPPEVQVEPERTPKSADGSGDRTRRTWTRPTLTIHGDLRQLTMGPSPGVGESANPLTFRNPA